MRQFSWQKQGLVFAANLPGFTYGFLPCALALEGDEFVVAFSCRDARQRSHIFLSKAIASEGTFSLTHEPWLALEPGPLGHFDSDGALSGSFLRWGGRDYLYYGGWENLVSVPYTANTGRLVFDRDALTLTREFPCPVLGRSSESPIFSGAPCFVERGDELWAWFTSATRWVVENGVAKHYYSLRRGVSRDGVEWSHDKELALPFKDEYEYAVARGSILELDGTYYMWMSHRASVSVSTYRIGLAWSKDLLSWNRVDDASGIDVSPVGWDSQMICYPHVFHHDGWLYMLYNGDDYGRTGFGCASMKLLG